MQVASPGLRRQPFISPGTLIALFVAAAIVLGGGLFLYQRFNSPPATPAQQTAQATRGTITSSISATGSVASTASTRLNFTGVGRVAAVNVSLGDQVEPGQVLATLDTSDLQLAVQQARANLVAAQAKLQQTLAGARPEDVQQAQSTLASAQAKLNGMQVSRPEDIAAARAALQAAQAKLAV